MSKMSKKINVTMNGLELEMTINQLIALQAELHRQAVRAAIRVERRVPLPEELVLLMKADAEASERRYTDEKTGKKMRFPSYQTMIAWFSGKKTGEWMVAPESVERIRGEYGLI